MNQEPSERKHEALPNKAKEPLVETSATTPTSASMNSASMYTVATASLYFPHVWKVVMDDDNNGIAFVIVNNKQTAESFSNLFSYDPQIFCNELGWNVTAENKQLGFTMCSKVEDLAKLFAFPHIPKLKERESFNLLAFPNA